MADEGPVEFVKKTSKRPQNLRKRVAAVEDEGGPQVKINKRSDVAEIEAAEGIKNLDVLYSATGSTALSQQDLVATAIEAKKEALVSSKIMDSVYRGKAGYMSFIEGSSKRIAGPVKSTNTANIRATCRFDYAADLCKDYNETGFCGFGDSCKFIHDRGDYKSGWELEQEWEAEQERKRQGGDQSFVIEEQAEIPTVSVPEICDICEKPFTRPIVVTKCMHYFCERCAINEAQKSKKCHTCGTHIDGQFSVYRPPKPL